MLRQPLSLSFRSPWRAALLVGGCLAAQPAAQTTTWRGATTSWTATSNWTAGVPSRSVDARIPAGAPRYPIVTAQRATCRHLLVEAGARVQIDAAGRLTAYDRLDARGSITGTGTVELQGSSGFPPPRMVIATANGATLPALRIVGAALSETVTQGARLVAASIELSGFTNFKPSNVVELRGAFAGDLSTKFTPTGGTVIFKRPTTAEANHPTDSPFAVPPRAGALVVESGATLHVGRSIGGSRRSALNFVRAQVDGTIVVHREAGSLAQTVPFTTALVVGAGGSYTNLVQGRLDPDIDCAGRAIYRGGGAISRLVIRPSGTLQTTASDIELTGDLIAEGTLTLPAGARIRLTGTGVVRGTVPELVVSGSYRFEDVTSTGALTVAAGGGVDVTRGTLRLRAASTTTVAGRLTLQAGARMQLGRGARTSVLASGELRLLGTASRPVIVDGIDHDFAIGGRIEASHFTFAGMGSGGVRILPSATFAAAPRDFRAGKLTRGSPAAGSVLLSIDRTAATTLSYLELDATGDTPHNVTSATRAPIRLVNAYGSLAGAVFERDPNRVIEWIDDRTELVTFAADGGFGRVDAEFRTRNQIDAKAFRLLRATSRSGPYAVLATYSPVPAGVYRHSATGLPANTSFYYRVEQQLPHDSWRRLGDQVARTFPIGWHGNTRFVPRGAGALDLQPILDQAPPGSNVLLEGGGQQVRGFTIRRPVRLLANRAQVLGAVVVENMNALDADVVLYGVESASDLTIRSCRNLVVVDQARFGTVEITDADRVKLQQLTASGTLTFTRARGFMAGTRAAGLRLQQSELTEVASSRGSLQRDASSKLTSLQGGSPRMEYAPVWPHESTALVRVQGNPGHMWGLVASPARGYHEFKIFFDMVVLLDPASLLPLHVGFLPASGSTTFPFAVPGVPAPGVTIPLQVFTFDVSAGKGRLGNLRDALLIR